LTSASVAATRPTGLPTRSIATGFLWLAVFLGGFVVVEPAPYELYLAGVVQRQKTRDVFNLALQQKTATGRPLIVVGDPDGYALSRVLGRDYDCADVCIDPRGCAKCGNEKVTYLIAGLAQVPGNSAVVFVAPGVLEREQEPEAALAAIQHAAGAGSVFIAPAPVWSIFSLFRRRVITAAPPGAGYTEWRDMFWVPGKSELRRLQP
jgi:hypothetical protein